MGSCILSRKTATHTLTSSKFTSLYDHVVSSAPLLCPRPHSECYRDLPQTIHDLSPLAPHYPRRLSYRRITIWPGTFTAHLMTSYTCTTHYMTSYYRLVAFTRPLELSLRTTWPRTPASLLPPGPSARPHARPCSRSWRGLSCELPGWRRCSVWLSHPCSGRLRPPSSSSLHSRTYASSGSCSYWRSLCYRVCKHFARLKYFIQ